MNRFRLKLIAIVKRRMLWFLAGLAFLPTFRYAINFGSQPTAFEAMGWVSHYQESKHFMTLLPDFSYSLKFPGDRQKFENFIKKMNLQNYKVSEDEYKEESNGGGRRAIFLPDGNVYQIEFTANQT